ncbi:tumor necrosis factor receptor superfamily member 1B-like [Falco rusticolus]|uniref:tumor necrosis factor receptor superfamily member 1B-like n=1 Tax=Falco rusticolus TaxID=120794 RepID=UPI00188650A0|nr:tumor necrosis factor receptor superfamily member 1B-like [Falco rusticolus]XP_055559955.1 tumor necrosis factor receptor superfamily member 1B [Falco cherrug]
MGPRWALLAALLHAAGGREYSLPYTPQFAKCKDPSTEFYEEELNKCCSQCPPGEYKTESCSHTVDTKCSPCSPNTYTAIWNRSPQCFACSPPCRKGFVQNQTCTKSQDRICSCPPNEYCISKIFGYCEICKVHKKCGKGYRVSRRGTDSTDTECKPCPPGTFSREESYDTSCIPHTVCKSVAIPGNSVNDTVCSDSRKAVATVLPHTVLNLLLTQSLPSNKPEKITRPVTSNSVTDVSYIIGSVAGPLLLVLIIAILGYCVVSKKKALVYSPPTTAADSPFSATEKQCDKTPRNTGSQNSSSSEQEEQHLLETSGSSSSALNRPTGSARVSVVNNKNNEKKKTEEFQQQHSAAEGCKLHSGDRHHSASSEHSGNGGTQVNVTCIVKVCSPDCNSQFPEQTSSTSMDYGNAPSYSPTGEEIPLSKEENPLKKETEIQISVENEDNLLQD